MYPELFHLGKFTVYSYGYMILTGAVLAWIYLYRKTRDFGLKSDDVSGFFLLAFAAVFVGGKLFFYLEDPMRYIQNPAEMLESPGAGFVFYGSFLLAVPAFIWWFRRHKLPVWTMFDIIAGCGTLVHGFGRIGCFMAGCCYGKVCDPAWGIRFTHPDTHARPIGEPLYPTQLLEAALILGLFGLMQVLHKRKRFEGQLFLLYVLVYAAGRFGLEYLRGDESRGYLFGGLLSHSQLISLLLIAAVTAFWMYRSRQVRTNLSA